MGGWERGFYSQSVGFYTWGLVFSVICLLFPLFLLLYYIAMCLCSVVSYAWNLAKSHTLGLI